MNNSNIKNKYYDIIVLSILLAILSCIFIFTKLDIKIQSYFYKPGLGWFMKHEQPWDFLYRYGTIPAVLLSIFSVLLMILSYMTIKYFKYRKIALFLILTMLIGPGIIINITLKDHWGRYRPRQIKEFGGRYDYQVIWEKGASGVGESFPCGHCSMGYYLMIPYLFLRKKRKRLAYLVLVSGILIGSVIGIARMIQGAHFASDVVWSAGLVYLTASSIFYFLGMNKNIYQTEEKNFNKKYSKLIIVIGVLIILIIIIAVLFATPFYKTQEYNLNKKRTPKNKIITRIILDNADINIKKIKTIDVDWEAHGFGFPGSKVIFKSYKKEKENHSYIYITNYTRGWFTELNQKYDIKLPYKKGDITIIKLGKGNIDFFVKNIEIGSKFRINIDDGDMNIYLHENNSLIINTENYITNNSNLKILKEDNKLKVGNPPYILINLNIENGICRIN